MYVHVQGVDTYVRSVVFTIICNHKLRSYIEFNKEDFRKDSSINYKWYCMASKDTVKGRIGDSIPARIHGSCHL